MFTSIRLLVPGGDNIHVIEVLHVAQVRPYACVRAGLCVRVGVGGCVCMCVGMPTRVRSGARACALTASMH